MNFIKFNEFKFKRTNYIVLMNIISVFIFEYAN